VTAIAARRRRRTIAGVVAATALVCAAAVMFVVGVVTLSNSQEGQAVGVDTRPREVFPATPNALLAVTDDEGRLGSVVVLTLLPEGVGGSIVTLPPNADATAGFGVQRRPLDVLFDPERPDDFVFAVEDMLSVTLERSAIVGPDEFAALIEPLGSVQVVLPDAVIDSDAIDPEADVGEGLDDPVDGAVDAAVDGVVVTAGPQTLSPDDVAVVLTAIDDSVSSGAQHPVDVAMWSAIADATPLISAGASSNVDAVSSPPATVEELVVRLLSGEVAVRNIASSEPSAAINPTDADVLVLDRPDAALVFAQVSPALVSTPNPGLKIRVVAQYTDEQLAQTDGLFSSTSDVARGFIDQMLVLQNNVVSADTTGARAPDVTVIEVADPRRLEETQAAAEVLFGQAEVRVAEVVLEGVDLEITLGMTYLIREMVRVGVGVDDAPDTATDDTAPSTTGTVVGDG
jgi:hypothetical protein